MYDLYIMKYIAETHNLTVELHYNVSKVREVTPSSQIKEGPHYFFLYVSHHSQ